MAGIEMTPAEIEAFLAKNYFCAVASIRKNGYPNILPLGYVYDGKYIYLSIRNGRPLIARVKRDPRVCFSVFNNEYPTIAVTMHGRAEVVDDPGNEISMRMQRRSMPNVLKVPMDMAAFEKNWLSHGRTVIRITPEEVFSFDSNKKTDLVAQGGVKTAREFEEYQRKKAGGRV